MSQNGPNIVIIGGGIAGLSTAYALLERGVKSVQVLEAREQAGHGASWANSSMIHPSQAFPWPEAGTPSKQQDAIAIQSYDLAARSSEILRAHFDRFNLPHRHRKSGTVKLYDSADALEAGRTQLAPLIERGLRIEPVKGAALTKIAGVPGFNKDVTCGLYFPDDHSGPARLYCAKLIEQIMELGGQVKCNAEVAALDGRQAIFQDQEAVCADIFILCCGAQSATLGGVEVTPLRGYSRTFHMPDRAKDLPLIPIMDELSHLCLTPLGDHLRVAGGADKGAPDETIYARFERFAKTRLPHLAALLEAAERSDWTALRPMSAVGPIVGPIGPRLWANTGHGHMGWTLCAGAAEKLAAQILA